MTPQHQDNDSADVTTFISLSGDASCNGLYSSKEGQTMVLHPGAGKFISFKLESLLRRHLECMRVSFLRWLLMIYFSGQWWVMFPAWLGEERQTVAEPGHQAQTRDYSGSGDKRLSQTLINKTLWCVSKVNKSKKGVSFNYSYQCWHFRTQTWPRCQCCEGRAK